MDLSKVADHYEEQNHFTKTRKTLEEHPDQTPSDGRVRDYLLDRTESEWEEAIRTLAPQQRHVVFLLGLGWSREKIRDYWNYKDVGGVNATIHQVYKKLGLTKAQMPSWGDEAARRIILTTVVLPILSHITDPETLEDIDNRRWREEPEAWDLPEGIRGRFMQELNDQEKVGFVDQNNAQQVQRLIEPGQSPRSESEQPGPTRRPKTETTKEKKGRQNRMEEGHTITYRQKNWLDNLLRKEVIIGGIGLLVVIVLWRTIFGGPRILFSDEFQPRLASGWQSVAGTWRSQEGHMTVDQASGWQRLFVGNEGWQNYKVEFDVTLCGTAELQVVVRSQSNLSNRMIIVLDQYDSQWYLIQNGSHYRIGNEGTGAFLPCDWSHVEVRAQGDNFSAFVNGTHILSVQDATLSNGRVGIAANQPRDFKVDNFKVTALP